MLQESARDFLQDKAPVRHLRDLRDRKSNSGFADEIWLQMAAMGWPAMAIPEAYGGLGFGYSGLGIVLQETGRTLTPSPLLSTAMMSVAALLRGGSEAVKTSVLPAVAAGETLVTLACDESSQYRPTDIATRLSRNAGGYLLRGRKRFVMDGVSANMLLISARSDPEQTGADGISLLLAPANADGIEIERRQALDTHVMADIALNDVQLPASALIGTENRAFDILEYTLDVGRIGQSAELLGIALEAFERTLVYLRERRQFGVPIGSFQALQHRAAKMYAEIEMCKSLVLDALQKLDGHDGDVGRCASMTKAKLAETAMRVTSEAIQMHGGIGMTDDFDIGFFLKRARIVNTLLGDPYYHLDRFARLGGY